MINLQGDMPVIDPNHIISVNLPLINGYEMGTLATNLTEEEKKNHNVTKVLIDWSNSDTIGKSIDFFI